MDAMSDQPLQQRGDNRTQRPTSQAFRDFMANKWGDPTPPPSDRSPAADSAAEHRRQLASQFPGERLVIPAGTPPVRSNDTDYRFRPHSAFVHLTGLSAGCEPESVLVLHPLDQSDAASADPSASPHDDTHEAVLYMRPASGRDTAEFYADARNGEFWVGRRPTLEETGAVTGIRTEHIDSLTDALAKDAGPGSVALRVIRSADQAVNEVVEQVRTQAGFTASSDSDEGEPSGDDRLDEATSELRLIKTPYEVDQLRKAMAATISGFERVVAVLPRAAGNPRGERLIETAFEAGARIDGNGTGYDTIAAAGPNATTLHWTANTGPVETGQLLLLDAGVEVDSFYTADLTRTLPVSGHYSPVQRRVWQAVVDAADAAFAAAVPGQRFRDVHDAAMQVIAQRLAEWGLLPVSAAESLTRDGQQHRRWMVHGTSHHLGIDVHDCARARAELYLDGILEPGMVFTIEPGLYFKPEDLAVPPEYRGIGARCEDDVLITADGNENLSAKLPRQPDEIEQWMARVWAESIG
jgi:Xaa-Pro aminopeptidase